MPKILKVKDNADKFHKKMPVFDLPFKVLLNSKSQYGIGKTTIALNLILNPEFGYTDIFKGKNIFIITDNDLDNKLKTLQQYKQIPESNIMSYNENDLTALYDEIEEKFKQEKADKDIQYRLMLFDDVGYSGNLKNKNFGIITKLVSNGRHLNISQLYTSQSLQMTSTILRNQLSGLIVGSASLKELELLSDSFNYLSSKKEFISMFRKYTNEPRSFLVLNFTGKDGLYYDKDFKPIKDFK
tara:strand:- start:361 stop:1083 length:723 start_codon:yes stop_codon:yes gene_type:complete